MRSRRSSARWLLLALLMVPGCLFRPIFHPPSATGGDGGTTSTDAGDNRHQDGSATDASAGIDVTPAPNDDCSGFYDQSSGEYAADAHHADGAICMLPGVPGDAGTTDASADVAMDASATDATDDTTDAGETDAGKTDASDDAADASVSDATDDADDSATGDDATPADPDAGE